MQAVEIGHCFYITAYQKGKIRLADNLLLEIQTPGIYMLSTENGTIRVVASDPTHTQSSLSLKINNYERRLGADTCCRIRFDRSVGRGCERPDDILRLP